MDYNEERGLETWNIPFFFFEVNEDGNPMPGIANDKYTSA